MSALAKFALLLLMVGVLGLFEMDTIDKEFTIYTVSQYPIQSKTFIPEFVQGRGSTPDSWIVSVNIDGTPKDVSVPYAVFQSLHVGSVITVRHGQGALTRGVYANWVNNSAASNGDILR